MRKLFFIVIALISLTGCFDILEEVSLNKNGSGQYLSKIDASKLAEQLELFAAMDTTGEMIPKMKYSLDSTFLTTFSKYKTIKGIENVKMDTSKDFIYIVSMDFNNIEALNEALAIDKPKESKNLYAWQKGKLTRNDNTTLDLKEFQSTDADQKEMMSGFLQDMKYTIVYHLPGKVKNVTNKAAKISEDKKTVTLESNMKDILDGKMKLSNEVKFK